VCGALGAGAALADAAAACVSDSFTPCVSPGSPRLDVVVVGSADAPSDPDAAAASAEGAGVPTPAGDRGSSCAACPPPHANPHGNGPATHAATRTTRQELFIPLTLPDLVGSTQLRHRASLHRSVSSASASPIPDAVVPADVARVPGERLGAYELLIDLASGGMATVWLARATDLRADHPLVAVKRPHRHLTGDRTFLTMLVDEARLASAIDHPNVVKVRELGFDAGVPFIVMDYVEGASLAELRRELSAIGRALDVRVATRIACDALAGLHAAHQLCDEGGRALHIIHRDVSPHNVLIGCDGRAHLTDFGIAKAEDRIQTTRTHEVKGKLAYLAPERVDSRRVCTVQSDVFSMAVVVWECFAGRRLFRGEDAVDILQGVMSGPIPTLTMIGAHLPQSLDDVIARALSRDLDVRYATALDFAHAIEEAAGPDQVGTHADVARLMEAIFGPRMALRQEQVRAAVGNGDLVDLLRDSGLPARERSSIADMPTGQLLAELAPPAPTGRYALGTDLRPRSKPRSRRATLWIAGAVVAGSAIGASVTLGVVARRPGPAAVVVRAAPSARVSGVATARKVVVPLPFAATQVTFDDTARDIEPATAVVAFDVPADSGPRHRVTAIAADGTRAEGYVREEDGVARPDASGYSIVGPDPATADSKRDPQNPAGRPIRPIGKVRNGFTKLK
jgi:eukaryotic-like serine/threonine-protein kinase